MSQIQLHLQANNLGLVSYISRTGTTKQEDEQT